MSKRRPFIAAAGLAACLIAGVGAYVWDTMGTIEEENRTLAEELKRLDGLAKKSGDPRAMVEAVRAWEADGVNWLDELRDLSLRLPPARNVAVRQMSIAPGRGGGAAVHFQGFVSDPPVVTQIEKDLRDANHLDVRSKHVLPREGEKTYTRSFEVSLTIVPRAKAEYQVDPRAQVGSR